MRAADGASENLISPMTAWAYRHQARRLRHQFRDDPVGLHESLRALAARANQESRKSQWVSQPQRNYDGHTRDEWKSQPVLREDRPARKSAPRMTPWEEREDAAPSPAAESPAPRKSDYQNTAAILQTPADAVEQFSLLVRTMLGEGVLRYSRRQMLMKQAKKLGIKPFEASLLIATIEHRVRNEPEGTNYVLKPPRRWSLMVGVAALLALEVAAVGALAVIFL